MADDDIVVQVRGLTELQAKFKRYPEVAAQTMRAAAGLVGDAILNTDGVKHYPPETAANLPPEPYYIRGVGTQTKLGNAHNSERLGTKFYVIGEISPLGSTVTKIGNPVSYAPYVVGDDQARAMARIGWRKLRAVAKEKVGRIQQIFEALVQSVLRRSDLN